MDLPRSEGIPEPGDITATLQSISSSVFEDSSGIGATKGQVVRKQDDLILGKVSGELISF